MATKKKSTQDTEPVSSLENAVSVTEVVGADDDETDNEIVDTSEAKEDAPVVLSNEDLQEINEPDIDDEEENDLINKATALAQQANIQVDLPTIKNLGYQLSEEKWEENSKVKWATLYARMKTYRAVTAQVSRIMEVKNSDQVCAICTIPGYEEFQVVIPYEKFIAEPIANKNNDPNFSVKKEKRKNINKYFGATVSVFIEKMDDGYIYANRVYANYLLRRKYYFKGIRMNGKRSIIGKNTVINNCRIITVYKDSVICEAYGAIFRIPVMDLQYEYVDDLRNYYYPGQIISALVTNIVTEEKDENGTKTYRVSILANAQVLSKDIEKITKIIKAMSIGTQFMATVQRFTKDGTILAKTQDWTYVNTLDTKS